MSDIESVNVHRRAVEVVVAAGGTVSPEWERIAASWQRLAGFGDPAAVKDACEALADAVITGSGDVVDLAVRYLALTAGPVQAASVRNAVVTAVYAALRTEYRRSTGAANLGFLAGRYDTAARALTDAMAVTDVMSPPERAVMLEGDKRQAWFAARKAVAQIDEVVLPLRAAAVLSGEYSGLGHALDGGTGGTPGFWLGLLVDRTGVNPRRLWETWTENEGIDRWAGLVRLGGALRFAGPDEFRPLGEPAGYRVIQVRGGHGWIQAEVDPYDDREAQVAVLMAAPGMTRDSALQLLDGVPCAA
ncbi:hypothetical protein ACFQ34_09655 [Pseudonocardia benzenivorans]|uniref:Uncharacterized protein n=1 Tax=Pseudonocardia benzenivorans TaxID=228005 RepID=A0ABW3VFP8_9PSEU